MIGFSFLMEIALFCKFLIPHFSFLIFLSYLCTRFADCKLRGAFPIGWAEMIPSDLIRIMPA